MDTGKTTPTLVYLKTFGDDNVPEWKNTIEGMIRGFKIMAARLVLMGLMGKLIGINVPKWLVG